MTKRRQLPQAVIDRLLLAKGLLGPLRFTPTANPDRKTLARHILTAHDAAEMALAAIAQHLNVGNKKSHMYLMDYVVFIQNFSTRKAKGREYFSKLNQVRVSVKHLGIFPDPKDWFRVGETTWNHVAAWCQHYLKVSLDDLDEAALISDPDVRRHYTAAAHAFNRKQFKESLQELGTAAYALFKSNRALRNLHVGVSRAEDAIKLSAFGVHANDYLALQEFLPRVYEQGENLVIKWEQKKHGHPANWTVITSEFCLKTLLEIVLRIQDADWIPGAIDFTAVYEYRLAALEDGVEIVQEQRTSIFDPQKRVVVRVLNKGETLRCMIFSRKGDTLADELAGTERAPVFSIYNHDAKLGGEIEAEKVRVTCVPRDLEWVKEYFPGLPEIEYEIGE